MIMVKSKIEKGLIRLPKKRDDGAFFPKTFSETFTSLIFRKKV